MKLTEDYDALSQKHLASIKRDTRVSFEDAVVRATHKVMANQWTPKDMAYRPGGLVRTEPAPTPEQLAALGWQSIECPFCGTSGAQAFPKPETDWEGIAADQAMTIALMKSEQEPVAWISKHGVVYPLDAKDEVNPINELQPLYTAPPSREWVGLTGDDMDDITSTAMDKADAMLLTEAKLKEKNNGI